jgi:hypothetical protein
MRKINLAVERKAKRQNLKSNLEFIDFYVRYMKGKSNKEWSAKQAKFINNIYRSIPKKSISVK